MYKYLGLRQTFIHIHQSIITASNSDQVYCILDDWCVWISLCCGTWAWKKPETDKRALLFLPYVYKHFAK